MKSQNLNITRIFTTLFFLAATFSMPLSGSAGELIGNFAGKFAVSGGRSSYTLPIRVPKGPAGMSPSLALVYNSGAKGDWRIGEGWSLAGSSEVARCPKTITQNEAQGRVNYNANDKFCLGGQQLVAVNGAYGAAGSEYRTEIDDYSKITAHGQHGSGPAYWQVQTKAGLIHTYGQTSDSKLIGEGQSSVHYWSLSQTEDLMGNKVAYSYHNQNHEFYLKEISYSNRKIEFVYNEVTNFSSKYHNARILFKQNHRLSAIKVHSGGVLLREYSLNHSSSYNRTSSGALLKTIILCHSGGDCFRPIEFSYKRDFAAQEFNVSGWADTNRRWWVDFNGDGKQDFCRYTLRGMRCSLASGDGFSDLTLPISGWADKDRRWWVDFNGDGKQDFCRYTRQGMRCSLSTGDGFNDITLPVSAWGDKDRRWWVDFNGDGKQDFCRNSSEGMLCSLSADENFREDIVLPVNEWGDKGRRWWVDFNGDGKQDFCRNLDYDMLCSLSNGQSFSDITFSVNEWGYEGRRWWVDFNGDGKNDFCRDITVLHGKWDGTLLPINHVKCSLSTGQGFRSVEMQKTRAPYTSRWWVDVNGDGKQDLCQISGSSGVSCEFSNGETFRDYLQISLSGSDSGDQRWWTDINGDGKEDFCRGVGNLMKCELSIFSPYVMSAVDNNGGREIDIDYNPMESLSVKETRINNGIGGQNTTVYNYGDFRIEPYGRGSLGFGWIEESNLTSGEKTRIRFLQDFPLIGQIMRAQKFLNNAPLSEAVFYYQSKDGANSKIKQVWLGRKEEYSHSLNSSFTRKTETSFIDADEWGNIKNIVVKVSESSHPGDNSSGYEYASITANVWLNDPERWILGRLKSSQVTQK